MGRQECGQGGTHNNRPGASATSISADTPRRRVALIGAIARLFSHVEEFQGKLRRGKSSVSMQANISHAWLKEELDGVIEEFRLPVAALERLLENSLDRLDAVDALGSIESDADQLAGFATLAKRFAHWRVRA